MYYHFIVTPHMHLNYRKVYLYAARTQAASGMRGDEPHFTKFASVFNMADFA